MGVGVLVTHLCMSILMFVMFRSFFVACEMCSPGTPLIKGAVMKMMMMMMIIMMMMTTTTTPIQYKKTDTNKHLQRALRVSDRNQKRVRLRQKPRVAA